MWVVEIKKRGKVPKICRDRRGEIRDSFPIVTTEVQICSEDSRFCCFLLTYKRDTLQHGNPYSNFDQNLRSSFDTLAFGQSAF